MDIAQNTEIKESIIKVAKLKNLPLEADGILLNFLVELQRIGIYSTRWKVCDPANSNYLTFPYVQLCSERRFNSIRDATRYRPSRLLNKQLKKNCKKLVNILNTHQDLRQRSWYTNSFSLYKKGGAAIIVPTSMLVIAGITTDSDYSLYIPEYKQDEIAFKNGWNKSMALLTDVLRETNNSNYVV